MKNPRNARLFLVFLYGLVLTLATVYILGSLVFRLPTALIAALGLTASLAVAFGIIVGEWIRLRKRRD